MRVESKRSKGLSDWVFAHRRRLIALFILAALLLMSIDRHAGIFHHEGYEQLISASGWILVLTGIVVRFWASLYIAGNRDKVLQTSGPYGLVRNPLYLGNLLSAAGIGLLSASLIATLLLMIGMVFVFYQTIEHEDRKLLKIFGDEFLAYHERTPRLLPRVGDLRRFTHDAANRQMVSYANLGSELRASRGVLLAALLVYVYSALLSKMQNLT